MKPLMVLIAVVLLSAMSAQVVTQHYGNSRIGSTSTETILKPSNVAHVAKIWGCATDGAIYSQPLYVPGVVIGGTPRNLVIVATMNDSLYAFDADALSCVTVWSNLAFDTTWSTGYPDAIALFYGGPVGCLATPVIDASGGAVYAVCANNTPNWIIRKFSLTTGAVVTSRTLAPSVTGTGDPLGVPDNVTGGVLSFYPKYSTCRPGLTLANSKVYVACGSYDDIDPWHGWVVSYDTATLTQQNVWCSTPNGAGGAFWSSGGGLAVDSDGNLYGVTSNGDYDGSSNFSMSAVKLSPTLALLDWFTPSGWSALSAADIDLGSGQQMLIPGTTLLVWGAKDFKSYSVDTSCMGHLAGTVGGCTVPQVFLTNPSPPANAQAGVYLNMFMNGKGYFANTIIPQAGGSSPASVYVCTLTGSTWNTTCTASASTFASPGASPAGSINGTSDGIIWLLTVSASAHTTIRDVTLRAVNPADFTEYWNSGAIGKLTKFSQPTVANGRVFVPTQNAGVIAFGIPPSGQLEGGVILSGSVSLQ